MSDARAKLTGGWALWRGSLLVGALLMLLLALTLSLAFVPLGAVNGPVSYAIALAKALLVVLVFMKLKSSPALLSLAVLAGVFWLATLFAMTLTDYPFRQTGEQGRAFPGEAPADPPPSTGAELPDN